MASQRPKNLSVEEYFWYRVDFSGKCWIWTKAKDSSGYGTLAWRGKTRGAHRVAFKLAYGYLPDKNYQLDHLCRNRLCVRPSHLEIVTSRQNTLRGSGLSAIYARRSHCSRGHLYTETNTLWHVTKGRRPARRCKECRKLKRI